VTVAADPDVWMARMWWDDLAGTELLARLTQRGIRWPAARNLVRDRDTSPVARRGITEALAR
jgi:hypothetical protein